LRVAITRPQERSAATVKLVEIRGWEAIIVPTVKIQPIKGALKGLNLEFFNWMIITSVSGAEIVYQHYGKAMKSVKIACIGPKTAKYLKDKNISVSFIPEKYDALSLAKGLLSLGITNLKILVARASIGRRILVKELEKKADVTEVSIYNTVMVSNMSGIETFSNCLNNRKLDAIIFTSSQAATNLLSSIDKSTKVKLNEIIVCAIGPITASTLSNAGIVVDVTPSKYTVEACLDEIEAQKS